MNEQAAERKVVSILFLSLGSAGRKNLTDRHPYKVISTERLAEMRETCDHTFKNQRRNRTLEGYKFFSRKQQNNETLRQFWNALTGLVARCDFGNQTESLIMDAFIQNMQKTPIKNGCARSQKKSTTSTTTRGSLRRRHQPAEEFHSGKRNKERAKIGN